MNWFILALLAPLIWALVNLIDDHLLRSVYRSAGFGAIISGIVGFLPAIYIFIFHRPELIETKLLVPAVLAGILTVLFYYFYFRTLESDDTSVAIALNNLTFAIVPFLAFFILHERLQFSQYVGVAIIVSGSFILASLDIKKLRFAKSIWFALCGAFAYALVSILAKYAYEGSSFAAVYFWIATGFGIGGLIAFLLFKDKQQFKKIINWKRKKLFAILLGAELLNMAGEVVQGAAISGGPVTVVRALEGIQPVYVLIIGIVMSKFFPAYFRERRDARFYRKIACMAFMIAGLFML